jgi:hypothetical protein
METIETGERRKPGRPRKYAQGRHQAAARFSPARYRDLAAAAEASARSISEEIEYRIEKSFSEDRLLEIARGEKELKGELLSIAIEQLKQAMARITELMARITELERAQTFDEEMIERGVTKALAKARISIGGDVGST